VPDRLGTAHADRNDENMTLWPAAAVIVLIALRIWAMPFLFAHAPGPYASITLRAINIAIVVGIAIVADRAIRHFYWHRYLRHRRNRETPELVQDIVTVVVVLFGLALGLWWQAGLSITGIAATSGAIAFVLGIALQPVIQDLFSGLSVNFDQSYTIGDWITVYSDQLKEPAAGRVAGISWRTTFLTLEDGRRMMFPNRVMTSNPIANHSRAPAAKQLSVEIEVDIRVPQHEVMHLLLGEAMKAVRRTALATTPVPEVLVDRLTSDAAVYKVRFHYYPDQITAGPAKSIVLQALHEVLQQRALPLPVTQVELTQPPELELDLSREKICDLLRRVRLFRNALDNRQLEALAKDSRPRIILAGESLMRQGESADSMFLILEGAARVSFATADGQSHEAAISAAGDMAGEMSLLTGAPRSATVTALTQLRVLEIGKDAIQRLLDSAPDLFERFSKILAQRQHELDQIAESHEDRGDVEAGILSRMRSFFSRSLRLT
jgi:small-conductance mechanosensitive channel/CRP-like cAMP-binding protein